MKYVMHLLVIWLITLPATVIGYLWAAVIDGFENGIYLQEKHEDAILSKFCTYEETNEKD